MVDGLFKIDPCLKLRGGNWFTEGSLEEENFDVDCVLLHNLQYTVCNVYIYY